MLLLLILGNVLSGIISVFTIIYLLLCRMTSAVILTISLQILNLIFQSIHGYQGHLWTLMTNNDRTPLYCWDQMEVAGANVMFLFVCIIDYNTSVMFSALNGQLYSLYRLKWLKIVIAIVFLSCGLPALIDLGFACNQTHIVLMSNRLCIGTGTFMMVYDSLQNAFLLQKLWKISVTKKAREASKSQRFQQAIVMTLLLLVFQIASLVMFLLSLVMDGFLFEILNHLVFAFVGMHCAVQALLFVNLREYTVALLKEIQSNAGIESTSKQGKTTPRLAPIPQTLYTRETVIITP
ncbi:hypothetical protein EDD86DRAFT_204175 [Gorgonomyces haynaldii]|nr:hypothetical protein EDD86DRAFT_204175 [Gorgonomyces haynaldii]